MTATTPGATARDWRRSLGWSVRRAATAAGVSPPTWTNYEHDRKVSSLSVARIEALIVGDEPESVRGETDAAAMQELAAEVRALLPQLRQLLADRRHGVGNVNDGSGDDPVA